MSTQPSQRGLTWFQALAGQGEAVTGLPASLCVADLELAGRPARWLAVVADAENPFPRARQGEVGLLEGWGLAQAIQSAIAEDRDAALKRTLIALVDVPSQAYGRREEAYGIHQALAGAAGAYAEARLAGHPVLGLLVGKAMSGGFLAHGYQANRLLALRDPQVQVHAMGKASAARVTLRSVEELESLAADIPPMAYDLDSYASLGLLWRQLEGAQPDQPSAEDVQQVRQALADAQADVLASGATDLRLRLDGANRAASREVRERLRAGWNA